MKPTRWIAVAALILLAADTPKPYPRSVPPPPNFPEILDTPREVIAADGTKLVLHEWAPPNVPASRPVVLFIHGIGMHGEPYGAVGAGFTAREITFDALDLRGHGRSGGIHGELARPEVLRSDIAAAIDHVRKRRPQATIFLAGESMGGLLAADYARRGDRRLSGLILLVPAFAVDRSRLQGPRGAGGLFRIPLDSKEKLAQTVRDPAFVEARRADPLALHEVRLRYLLTILMIQSDWPQAAAEIRLPLFIAVAGRDQVVDSAVAKRVFDGVATPKPDKVWRKWDDAFHALCWDPAAPQIIAELASWILDQEARRR